MAKANHARALQGASGTCRNRRRPQSGRPAWVRPLCRAHRALDASIRLIGSTLRSVARTERGTRRRPIRTSFRLHAASSRLCDASVRLQWALRELEVTTECLALEPESMTAEVPELLTQAAERWTKVTAWLEQASGVVFSIQKNVLHGLRTGELVPERLSERRPRIILAPRPVPVRAFLHVRQPRVIDRIAPILRRRRRTPRPAAVRVPRRNLLGRAPPLPISLL